MDSRNVIGAFIIEDASDASIVKHHIQRTHKNEIYEYSCDEISSKDSKIKYRFLFCDETLFTEINSFIKKMKIKIKKYNLKKLKKVSHV